MTNFMSRRSWTLGGLWETWDIALVLVGLIGVAAVLDPRFLSESNVQSILRESAYVGIAAAGRRPWRDVGHGKRRSEVLQNGQRADS